LGWRSDATVAFVEATGATKTSGCRCGRFASALVGGAAHDRGSNRTTGDRAGFIGRTNAKEIEIDSGGSPNRQDGD
jgi:hypothetical protein